MAGRPDIDTGQLQKADKLMSDIVAKFDTLARMDEIPALKLLQSDLDNVDKKLELITKATAVISKQGQKNWKVFAAEVKKNKDATAQLAKEEEHLNELVLEQNKITAAQIQRFKEIQREKAKLNKQMDEELEMMKAVKKLMVQEGVRFLDWFGGSVASLGFSTVFAGLKMVATGLERVYDLQEKWTHAIGTFRKSIGPATKDSQLFEKSARDMQKQLYGLGMGFDASFQEMTNFVKGFGFANEEANKWSKQAVQFGVVTGAGTESIAELSRNLMLMGVEQQKQKGYFSDMIGAANAAGVSVADFTKEVAGSKDSLAEFGETGQKMFMSAAAWARKLGVGIKSLQNIIKLTDTFSSTAEAAAKMNTVFGTSINSMDLMLEQDPAKRFNMLRDSLIGVGKDMKNLSRLEKKLVADTLGMTMEETNAFLASGKDYNKFIADKQKAEEKAAKATAHMNDMMTKASTTMYEWGLLAQNVIEKFQPIVQAFLKGMGVGFETVGNASKTFGDKILGAVDDIVKAITEGGGLRTIQELGASARSLFTEILKPENIKSFVGGLTSLFNSFGKLVAWITNMAASPAIKMISWLIEKIGSIGHIVAGAWAGAKAGAAVGSLFGAIGAVPGAVAGALIGGSGAALAGSMATAGDRNLTEDKAYQAKHPGMSLEQAGVARAEEERASFVPAMADGGPVQAHHPYTVGEVGPEIFVPSSNGTIVPNGGGFLPVQMTLRVMLDSREIQRIPFDTTLPVNVSVVGA